MRVVLTVSAMREIDAIARADNATDGYVYMQRAGRAVYTAVLKHIQSAQAHRVAIFCGKGNNGGDGLVVARMLAEQGTSVDCFLLCDPSRLKGEAALAYADYARDGRTTVMVGDESLSPDLSPYSLIVDALLGTGLSSNPQDAYKTVIEAINSSELPVVSIDIPSGLDASTAIPYAQCVTARETIVAGFVKIGQYFFPGKAFSGIMGVADLGYPAQTVNEHHQPRIWLAEETDMPSYLPPRKENGSKFDHGLVACVVGSDGMSGAAAFAAESALRTGCGMVHVLTTASVATSLAVTVPEAVLHIQETDLDAVLSVVKRCQALCIGCGLSHRAESSLLVRNLIPQLSIPTVLDADGLNAFKDCSSNLRRYGADLIITPHQGEWNRLFGELPAQPEAMIGRLISVAKERQLVIVHKGNPTIVVSPDEQAFLLPFGTSALSTAGTGDVLSGMIASLLAQGAYALHAAILGVYLHQMAGRTAARSKTEYGVIARDVIESIPQAIADLIVDRKVLTF